MKYLLLLFLISPFHVWAQTDMTSHAQTDTLKQIGSELVPAPSGRYGQGTRTQYTYDGIDVRSPKDLGKYILVSGNKTAITEFNSYMSGRQTGTIFVLVGSAACLGGIIGIINARSDPKSSNPFQGPARTETGPSGAGGLVVGLIGAGLIGAGWSMRLPGPHLRRAVQYYNKDLKQRGISWQLTPYSSVANSGVGLVGRF